jgi:nitroreductase
MDKIFDAIYARRSIRRYEERAVEKEKLVKLLEAGMAAPSACNMQVWEFVVVTDKDTLTELNKTAQIYNAPAVMVICSNTKNLPWKSEDWKMECGAAVENMMLAAVAQGLGSVWIGMFNEEAVRKLLNIPESINVMSLVCFGYPAITKTPKTKYDETAVFWNSYEPDRQRSLRTMQMLRDGYQEEV